MFEGIKEIIANKIGNVAAEKTKEVIKEELPDMITESIIPALKEELLGISYEIVKELSIEGLKFSITWGGPIVITISTVFYIRKCYRLEITQAFIKKMLAKNVNRLQSKTTFIKELNYEI